MQAVQELNALHHEYRAGRQHYEHNRDKFPIVWFTKSESEVVEFVRKHHRTRMVAFGLNDRTQIHRNDRGFVRAAREEEIPAAKNLLIDIDPQTKNVTPAHDEALRAFIKEANDYFQDLGLQPPAHASSGRGYHLLFAYPAVATSECPAIAARQRAFVEHFSDDYHKELSRLEARVDSTQDLRRMVKIYGTAKPEVGVISRFYGGERTEDAELRTHLLAVEMEAYSAKPLNGKPSYGPLLLSIGSELPSVVAALMRNDHKLRDLYDGRGKVEGDTTGSGYDFSLARRLLASGVSDVSAIATVLALRPGGSFQTGKDESYLRRTIANALLS